jgi:hypothetical protein
MRDGEVGCKTERSGRDSKGMPEHTVVGFGVEGACRARRGGHNMQQILVEGEHIGRGQVGGTSLDRGTVASLDNMNERNTCAEHG